MTTELGPARTPKVTSGKFHKTHQYLDTCSIPRSAVVLKEGVLNGIAGTDRTTGLTSRQLILDPPADFE
jgi:hypothetical protein